MLGVIFLVYVLQNFTFKVCSLNLTIDKPVPVNEMVCCLCRFESRILDRNLSVKDFGGFINDLIFWPHISTILCCKFDSVISPHASHSPRLWLSHIFGSLYFQYSVSCNWILCWGIFRESCGWDVFSGDSCLMNKSLAIGMWRNSKEEGLLQFLYKVFGFFFLLCSRFCVDVHVVEVCALVRICLHVCMKDTCGFT